MANLIDEQKLQELLDKDILELTGGKDLPPEKKQELYLKIAQTIHNRAILRIYNQLSENEGQELDKLLEADDAAKVQDYLRGKDIDLSSILTQEALAYKVEIYELFKNVQNIPKQE